MINVITRTCNRPNRFRHNVESMKAQKHTDYNHIVCVDNKSTEEYVKHHGYSQYVVIDGDAFREKNKPKEQTKRTYFPHNLYMNECHKHVKDGWVIYVDDDDRLFDKTALDRLNDMIEQCDEDTLIFFQTQRQGRLKRLLVYARTILIKQNRTQLT